MNNAVFGLITLFIVLFSSYFLSLKNNNKKSCGYINIFSLIYFLIQIQFTTLLLGTFGLLKPLFLFSLNIIISTIILFFTFKISILKKIYYEINKDVILKKIKSFGFVPLFFLFIFLINSLTILYRIVVLPQSVWDVNTYHLIAPIYWFQNEIIPKTIVTPVDRVNNMFLGNKIFDYWNILISKSLLYTELTQFIFAIILLYTIYLIMREINITKQNSLIFSILAVSFPTILIQMRTTHDHMSLLTLAMILIYSIVYYISENKKLNGVDLGNFIILGSLITAVKINGFIYIFVAVITLAVMKILKFKFRFLEKFNFKNLFKKSKFLIPLIIICIFVGGYWGIKNFIVYQNVFGEKMKYVAIKTEDQNNIFTFIFQFIDKLYSNLIVAPKRIIDVEKNYSVDSTSISGYGVQFFSFVLPILLIFITLFLSERKLYKDELINKAISFIIIFSFINQIILYSLYISYFNYRLFTLFPIMGLILVASFLNSIKFNKTQTVFLNLLIFLMLVFNYLIMPTVENTNPNRFVYAFSTNTKSNVSDYVTFLDNDWSIINLLPEDKIIIYHNHEDGFVLPYYDQQLKTRTIAIDEFEYKIENKILSFSQDSINKMKIVGVNYLHISQNMSNQIESVDNENFKKIYHGLYEFYYE